MSITIVPELSKQAAEQASELSRAISRDDKERKRSPVDDLEIASGRVDAATDQVERADQLWVEVATGHVEIGAVNNEIDTLLALLQKLDREGRFREELRVARSLSRLLAVAMRWLDLLRTLHKASAAAERLGDLHAKAWALHELGTLHLAARDLIRADRELSEASELRRGLGEDRALMATERNLQVLCRTLRQGMREGRIVERTRLGRFLHVSNTLLVIMFLLVFGAATTAVAATGVLSSGGATAAAARVNQVLPASGPASGGTIVTITGTGLGHARSVRFGHRSGTRLKVVSVTQLQVTTPPGAGTVPVTVVTYRGKSLPRSTARFTYTKEAVPTIVAIAPASGPTTGGTVVTITGQNLAKTSQVRFGSRNGTDLKTISATELQIDTPPGCGVVPVRVISRAGSSPPTGAARFRYVMPGAAREIDQVLPGSGPSSGKTAVTITGTGLAHATAVTFGGHDGTNLRSISATQLKVDTPAGSGTVAVTVITPAGDSLPSPSAKFTYTAAGAPTITAVAPARGPTAGGTVVTITGTGLSGATAVKFGPSDGTHLTRLGDDQLQVSTPAGSGTVPVIVATPTGASVPSYTARFTYLAAAAPAITQIKPDAGPAAGGTLVIIQGTNLAHATAVRFGSTDGTSVTPTSDTELQVHSPPGSGIAPVSVSSPTGTSPPSPEAQFTYTPTLAPTTTTLTCAPAHVDTGQSTSCTVAVAPNASGSAPAPTGTASLATDSQGSSVTPSGCTLHTSSDGSASCQFAYSPSTPGTATLTASYPGDANYAASTATAHITAINPPPPPQPTSTSLACSSPPRIAASVSPWTCKVTVADVGSANETPPTAAVSFTTKGGELSAPACTLSPASNDSASCTISAIAQLMPATATTAATLQLFPITADYPGDTTHSGSQTQYSPS